MGQGGSSEFKETFQSTVSQLSQVQLAEIGARFNELYKRAGGSRGRVIDREAFSKYFNLPVTLGDRLFDAFDKKKNGSIDFEEFVCGLAVVLHGSFSDKCQLLFEIFNMAGDEGVSREELHSLLSAVVHSTNTILLTIAEGSYYKTDINQPISDLNKAITSIVDAAFLNCDISRSGKLLPLEFEYWLKRNPKVLDLLLPSAEALQEQKDLQGTLGPLLLVAMDSVNEQRPSSLQPELNEDILPNQVTTTDDSNEEEEVDMPGSVEPPPSPKNEDEDITTSKSSEDDALVENKTEKTSVSASEQTLQLARQLSKELQDSISSPGSDDFHSSAFQFEEQEMEEEDRIEIDEAILSAWIPSPWVQNMLASGRKVAPEHLTQPGLLSLTGHCDPIGDVLASTFPNNERRTQLTANQVKIDEEGISTLLHNSCYHAALTLTSLFLSAHGQGMGQIGQMTMHTQKTLQMWSVRLALLCYLGRYSEAKEEIEAFKDLDQPDLYYQYNKHNYPDQIGSMVPYSMRLLHAQLPLYYDNPQLALNRLCVLQHSTQTVLKHIQQSQLPLSNRKLTTEEQTIGEEVWLNRLARVKCALGNCLFSIKDYSLAREVYEEVIKLLPDAKTEITSLLGRLCLLCGDVNTAEQYFAKVDLLSINDKSVLPLVHRNRGLVDIYKNQWSKAEQNFKSASTLELYPVVSLHNAAIAALYQGRLHEGIVQIEEKIKMSPSSLQPAILRTLFSCYELESTQAQAKKLSWLPLLGDHAPEGFTLTSIGLIT